jgi:hypothetical protein
MERTAELIETDQRNRNLVGTDTESIKEFFNQIVDIDDVASRNL